MNFSLVFGVIGKYKGGGQQIFVLIRQVAIMYLLLEVVTPSFLNGLFACLEKRALEYYI